MWDTIIHANIHTMRIPGGDRERIHEEIMAKISPKFDEKQYPFKKFHEIQVGKLKKANT